MDRPNWPQIVMKPMEEILVPNPNNLSTKPSSSSSFERRVKPQKAAAVNCPRCDSTNTKFCYYNNYSLSQPRYFCKTCRRYWTEGGTLRNIPVGGGSRKNKRSSSISSISSTNVSTTNYNSSVSKSLPDLLGSPSATTVPLLSQNPRIHHGQYGQDLNLGFASSNNLTNFSNVSEFLQVPNFDATSGIATSGAMNLFMPVPIPIPGPNSVYGIPEFRIPSLSFSLDGIGTGGGGGDGGGGGNGVGQSEGGRLLFPFEEVKTDTSTTDHDDLNERKDQNCDSNGFWNGMMGAGSW